MPRKLLPAIIKTNTGAGRKQGIRGLGNSVRRTGFFAGMALWQCVKAIQKLEDLTVNVRHPVDDVTLEYLRGAMRSLADAERSINYVCALGNIDPKYYDPDKTTWIGPQRKDHGNGVTQADRPRDHSKKEKSHA